MPVWLTMPPVVARPNCCVAASNSLHSNPPAAPDRSEQLVLPGEPNRLHDVVRARAPGDEHRAAVDGTVPDSPGLLVPLFARPEQGSAKPCPETGYCSRLDRPGVHGSVSDH